ncbi:MAG TPA: hypothetical protein VKC34_17235, partial [Blastocatellia bacterium]|nr:hypothetical protein [Blastocatellia bacterium]
MKSSASNDPRFKARALRALCGWLLLLALATGAITTGAAAERRGLPRLSGPDRKFLEDLSRRSFLYFREQADPRTGLVL